MVLAELGQKIGQALTKMSAKSLIGDEDVKELLNDIAQALLAADVNISIVKRLQDNIKTDFAVATEGMGINKRKVLQTAVFNAIKKMLDPGVKPFMPVKGKTNVVMFVGLQGAGKTTSCTKYGAYFQRKGFKTAVVCADTFRAGAFDQLRQNAVKAKLRFYGSLTESDPAVIAREGLAELKAEKYDLIIIDTSGRHKQEAALFEEMRQVDAAVKPNDIVFVMSATDGQGVESQARHFRETVAVGSVIVTKLDCHTKGGGALSAVAATHSPIVFIGTGEHVEDFDLFKPESFVQKMLGMGDVTGLLDTLKDANIARKPDAIKRITEGNFTIRDYFEVMEYQKSFGSATKFLEMVPGMSSVAEALGEQSTVASEMFRQMSDSLTAAEMDEDKVKKMMTPSRIHRIARGSGVHVVNVCNFIKSFTLVETYVKKMGKGGNRMAMAQKPGGQMANMQQQLAQMQKMGLNPDANMMQQLGQLCRGRGMGAMPNLQALTNMLQGVQRGAR